MKLIQAGHFEDKMRIVCQNCEAVFEITSEDIRPVKTVFSIWPDYSYTCPCCKKDHQVNDITHFTTGIQRALYTARSETKTEAQCEAQEFFD